MGWGKAEFLTIDLNSLEIIIYLKLICSLTYYMSITLASLASVQFANVFSLTRFIQQ